ncbi:hypothetical protein LJR219_003707 [Phenylobacterium sp. LjRoot219]|uniref:c-type cytochrome n=1 Tax=Phenylobacterium sp. LjRoot219 TaxID=3342283 RepID=UPI003ECFFFF2
MIHSLFALLLAMAQPAAAAAAPELTAPTFNHAQTQFTLRCGGCHGVTGRSPPSQVPNLRGSAGYFLCTPESREYLIRLPNVSKTQLSDADLAEVMNYVAFGLGEGKTPKGAKPFTGEEIHRLRKTPLTGANLKQERDKVVRKLVRSCGAPKDLLLYGKR